MSDIPREFVFTRYPGKQGTVWLRTAYNMFKQHRGPWVMVVLAYILALLVIAFVPLVGPYALIIMKPVFVVGLLAAAWQQERGGAPRLSHLFQGFRTNLRALLTIGVFFVVGITLAVAASSLVDGGRLIELVATRGSLSEDEMKERLGDPLVIFGMLFSTLLSLPVIVATWWAPAVVVFQDAGAIAALGASLRASLANWKALLVYVIVLYFYGVVIPGIWYKLTALLVSDPAVAMIVNAPMLVYTMFLTATVYIADYVSYRDVFHANETLAPLSRSPS